MTHHRLTRRAARRAAVGLAVTLGVLSSSACGGEDRAAPAASATSSATSPAAPSSSSSSSVPEPSTTSTTTAPAATAAAVGIRDFMFEVPASVAPGATVTVTNEDAEAHTVTSKAAGLDVKVAGRGGTATFTAPTKPDSYALTCDFHADMSGTLVVS